MITLDIQSLDASNASDVTERLAEAMPSEAPAVVDLGALRYFDLSGFAGILKWAAEAGRQVLLALGEQTRVVRASSRGHCDHPVPKPRGSDGVAAKALTLPGAEPWVADTELLSIV